MIPDNTSECTTSIECAINLLGKEIERADSKIATYHLHSERSMIGGITLLDGISTAAVGLKIPTLLVFMPFGLSFVVILSQYLTAEALALGGYKAAFEEEVNRLLGYPVSMWESRVARSRHRDAPTWALRVMVATSFLLLLGLGLAVGISELASSESDRARWTLTVICGLSSSVVGGALMVVSGVYGHRQFRRVYDSTRQIFKDARLSKKKALEESDRKYRMGTLGCLVRRRSTG